MSDIDRTRITIVLLLEDVTVDTADRRLLDAAGLIVRRGERFGVLVDDPEAGSAIVDLLAGRRQPLRGRVRVDGLDPVRHAALLACRIAVLGREPVPTDAAWLRDLALDRSADIWLVDDRDTTTLTEQVLRLVTRRQELRRPTVLLVTADRQRVAHHCERGAVLVRPRLGPPCATSDL